MSRAALDLTGQRFGKLVVRSRGGSRARLHGPERLWLCDCDCGKESLVTTARLRSGTVSCGCYRVEANRTHGKTGSFEHRCWKNMVQRVTNSKHPQYPAYGGRGITITKRWLKFENFLDDMGLAPDETYSIERKDVNGNYCPSNCVWLPKKDQVHNKRNSVYYMVDGKTLSLKAWAKELGVSVSTLKDRRRSGWSAEEIIKTPIRPIKTR